MTSGRLSVKTLVRIAVVGAAMGSAIAAAAPVHTHRHPATPAPPADAPELRVAALAEGLSLAHFSVRSRAMRRTMHAVLLQPAAPTDRRGLVLFLHADHGTDESTLSPELFSALRRLGPRAPAMLFVGGGQRSYWHDRAGARWARYLLRELLPAALRRTTGGDRRRVAAAGISMGAYGALDLARLHPGRFCAVAAHSPRLWSRWRAAESAQPGGFDDRRDFLRHDLPRAAARAPRTFAGQPIWLDAGRADNLARPRTMRFARTLRRHGVPVALHVEWPGGHGGPYWEAHWRDYLRFDVAALRRCGAGEI